MRELFVKRLVMATATAFMATLVAGIHPAAAGPKDGAEEVLPWMSGEEYAASTGLAPEIVESMPTTKLPDRFRVRLDDGSITEPLFGRSGTC